jgi:hypothetical protein
MLGLRRSGRGSQADREVERAEVVVAEHYGLPVDEAAVALTDEAAAIGVSVHAAALAAVANWATRTPVLTRIPQQR